MSGWASLNTYCLKRSPLETDGKLHVSGSPMSVLDVSAAARDAGFEALATRYPLTQDQIDFFKRERYIQLKNVFGPEVLATIRNELISIVLQHSPLKSNPSEPPSPPPHYSPETVLTGDAAKVMWDAVAEPNTQGWTLQMMWAVNAVVRSLVLSPRMGTLMSELFGCDAVRLYHDTVLSKVPGCERTKWHCDDGPNGYMAIGSRNVATVWIPLQRVVKEMGALILAKGGKINAWTMKEEPGCPTDEKTSDYDRFVAGILEQHGDGFEWNDYEFGDISIHATDCYHMAGPNHSTKVRMTLAITYFEDGAHMRTDVDYEKLSEPIRREWNKFAPGVRPGDLIETKLNPKLPCV